MCIANNHIFDYGQNGFSATLNTIHLRGVSTIGDKPFWQNGTCILAYSCIHNNAQGAEIIEFSKEKALSDISFAKSSRASSIIIIIHWGLEIILCLQTSRLNLVIG